MASINLMRIDTRLIHGQICTEWAKHAGINRIVVVDDDLSKDDFMSGIYLMAAPAGVKAQILSVEAAAKGWAENELGDGRILMLFKEPGTCYRLFRSGFPMKELNIGNLVASADKKNVLKNVFLDQKEFEQLKEIRDSGVKVYVQNVPQHSQVDFSEIEARF